MWREFSGSEFVQKFRGKSLGSLVLPALDRMLLPHAIVVQTDRINLINCGCSLLSVLPFLLSEDPLLLWSMEVCINVGKYLLHKVPKGFPDLNAGMILYFV